MPFKTWVTNEVLTSTDVNTYLGKQTIAQVTSVTRPASPAEGQTVAESDTDRITGFDGTAWQRLAHWSATGRTGTRLRRVANQSIPNSTLTNVSWDTEDADSDGLISVSSDTITVPSGLGGLWIVRATILLSGSSGDGSLSIQVNAVNHTTTIRNTSNATATWFGVIGDAQTIKVPVFQASGGALNLTGDLIAMRIGA